MLHTFIINLPHRIDRKEHMLSEIKKIKCDSYEFIDAISHENPGIGCNLSHLKCIEMAKDQKLEYVLILEDDVSFTENINDILYKSLTDVQKFDWNLLYLGGNLKDKATYVTDYLLRVKSVNTTHAYIIHQSFYDIVLNLTPEIIIDRHYRRLADIYPMYMCAPMVAFQIPSFSDLQQKHTDTYNELYNNFKRLTT